MTTTAKSNRLLPQFFHTLDNGFHTHLTIPVYFFSKYIEGRSSEKKAAELKSDGSDKTWRVKLTGRRLSDGWEGFAVAQHLQIGNVIVVRYEGDMIFHVSDLGSSCCEVENVKDDIGGSLLKKRLYPRTQVEFSSNDDDDSIELPRKKKLKKNEAEAGAVSSSSSDKSCFEATVTASSLRTDKLYLPQHFTSSNGLTRNCRKIVIIDGVERSWLLDLRLDESSDTFYISQRWRSFCDENSRKAGGFFRFKLVGNGETPVLSFCPTETIDNRRQRKCTEASQRESLSTELRKDENNKVRRESWEREKNNLRGRDSTPSSQKQFVTLTVTPYSVEKCLRGLPRKFTRENDINEAGMIALLGRDGVKQQTKLHSNKVSGSMNLGSGWKDFVEANGLKIGNSFTFKLTWEEKTPVLSLCCDGGQEEFSKAVETPSLFVDPCNKDENNIKKRRSVEREKKRRRWSLSTPTSRKEYVTLPVTPYSVQKSLRSLPIKFARENDINKRGMITLLGKHGIKQQTKLHSNKLSGMVNLGTGWRDFVKANGLKTGDSCTLKLKWEGTNPVLSLCPAECRIDRGQEEVSKAVEKPSLFIDSTNKGKISKEERRTVERERNHRRRRVSTSPSQKEFVTLTITPYSVEKCILHLPMRFTRENDINKPGMITLMGKDGIKQQTKLLLNKKRGIMTLGRGWRDFAKANSLKTGDSFTLKLIWEGTTPVLSLCPAESSIERGGEGECSETNKKKSLPIDNSKEENCKEETIKEESSLWEDETPMLRLLSTESMISTEDTDPRKRDPSPAIENRSVTLTLTPEDVRACKLNLPSQFLKDNGINKLGKMTILGENGMELSAFLLSRDGTAALEDGWDDFCEANGVKLGESFTLEFVNEQDKTTPVLSSSSDIVSVLSLFLSHFLLKLRILLSKAQTFINLCHRPKSDSFVSLEILPTMATTAKSTRLCPQFFHTLDNGFHTQLTIPVDFFSKYIEGRSLEMQTAEVKSDRFDITWRVEMTGRSLDDGWERFAVDHHLQIGNVIVVRYEGDMIFHVSDLGSSCCEIQDVQYNIGRSLLKKRLYPKAQVEFSSNDDDDSIELPRKKNLKKNCPEAEAEAVSSSSSDKSCFVALVTDSNLLSDKLYLPQHFTSSNGLARDCRKILVMDGGERSWVLDLRFDESSDTFYISRGWRSFCDENSKKAGGFFMFKLVGNGETPVLSFCPKESILKPHQQQGIGYNNRGRGGRNNRSQRDCSGASGRESLSTELSNKDNDSEDEDYEVERRSRVREKNNLRGRDPTPLSPKHFVTLTITPCTLKNCVLHIPLRFTRENDINKHGMIILLGKDGIKQQTKLNLNQRTGIMSLGKGWKDFVKANGFKTGDSFTLKLIWEGNTPVLSLCPAETNKKTFLPIDNNKEVRSKEESVNASGYRRQRVSTPSSQKQFVTLTITPYSAEKGMLNLPLRFTRENDINKPRMIILLGKDGIKRQTKLNLNQRTGVMYLGKGWKDFVKANGFNTGDSFTLKLIWEGNTPVLSLGHAETNQKTCLPIDNNKEERSKEESSVGLREYKLQRCMDSTSPSQNRFLTITITPKILQDKSLRLPTKFVMENGMNKAGMIYLLGKDGKKWATNLAEEKDGRWSLGNGWVVFAEGNEFKPGETFTLELIWEDETPILRFLSTESSSLKANNQEPMISKEETEPRKRDLSPAIGNRSVTLTLTHEDARACKLNLPNQFLKDNGINKLGKITILGENGMELSAYLLSRDGTAALEDGWVSPTIAKSKRLHPQFFSTLVNGFQTHLTIPVDFFSKYVEGSSVKETAELKSDASDRAWSVKMTGRSLSDGWEVFALAHDLQIGDMVLVRYEGDMVFHVSDLGPNCSEIPSKDNDGQDDIGRSLLKKRLYPTTQVDFSSNDDDNMELPRKKKVKKNSPEAEAEPQAVSSSSSDKSCFVALVTASNLLSDKLYLPQHFTSSNGLARNCRKILVMDGGERSWVLDLRFDESPGTSYISTGWRSFCDENSKKAGGFFMFKLVGNGETPVLSFFPEESINDRMQRDCSEASQRESLSTELRKDENKKLERRSWEREKNQLRGRDSTPSSQKEFVTLTITPSSVKSCVLRLPRKFTRENHINKPGMIALLGKDGKKQHARLLKEKPAGAMLLGYGWKYFVKANGFNTGDSFTLKLKWEGTTPVFSLCCEKSRSDKQSLFIYPSNKEETRSPEREKNLRWRDSTPLSTKHFVTLTITPYCVERGILRLPIEFTRENHLNKPGIVTMLGKDGIEHQTKLLLDKSQKRMYLGKGWKDLVRANGLKMGDSFTLKLKWEGTTPVLSLCPAESSIDRGGEGDCSETNQNKSLPIDNSKEQNCKEETIKEESSLWETDNNHLRCMDSASRSQNRFLTLTITPEILQEKRMHLPRQFVMENNMIKPGMIYLLGKDGKKWASNLVWESDGRRNLGNGWKVFAEANELKLGECFTLESIWEDETPMLKFLRT
ncbi:unnamed protein product [Microthlaspi erraticum]|uniref:TF-B3 domain-containing protein n=1 Tax=Microthlaspi erraticum TaxID=1685480 RepID=A0A6D2J6V9_9BRAS|nr:unnamed protein product [Microthlaspi erraticum]